MIEKLDGESRVLAKYMSRLSEEAYSASWMDGLEFALWHAVIHGPINFGRLIISVEHISYLKNKSYDLGGWVYFDEVTEQTFIKNEHWLVLYRDNIHKYRSRIG